VYGNSFKRFPVAIVVPDAEHLYNVAVSRGWWKAKSSPQMAQFATDFATLVTTHGKVIKAYVLKRMRDFEQQLAGFERVKDIHVEGRINGMMIGFNQANECLTPTMKLRRRDLFRRYLPTLKELYGNNDKEGTSTMWPGEEALRADAGKAN
jgi:long-subunit acyl-CoA synthetase (AMP-forming)